MYYIIDHRQELIIYWLPSDIGVGLITIFFEMLFSELEWNAVML
jgi:hypothetical protein